MEKTHCQGLVWFTRVSISLSNIIKFAAHFNIVSGYINTRNYVLLVGLIKSSAANGLLFLCCCFYFCCCCCVFVSLFCCCCCCCFVVVVVVVVVVCFLLLLSLLLLGVGWWWWWFCFLQVYRGESSLLACDVFATLQIMLY